MNVKKLTDVLDAFKCGEMSREEVLEELARLPFRSLEDATVDTHRTLRTGYPEVVFGRGKTAQQIVAIAGVLLQEGNNVLLTRLNAQQTEAISRSFPSVDAEVEPTAGAMLLKQHPVKIVGAGPIAVVSAGTLDLPVAREAAFTARALGNEVVELADVGVAGIHRLLHYEEQIRSANVLIVVAGMEGALPSLVAGLVSRPVIAVPTSVGYGASFGGIAALLGMLNSCVPGVTVVNIDNGFGAGFAAALINRADRANGPRMSDRL